MIMMFSPLHAILSLVYIPLDITDVIIIYITDITL